MTPLPDALRLKQELQRRAGNYYPDLAGREVGVELQAHSRRRFSNIYRYRLHAGPVERALIVKVPIENTGTNGSAASRPPCDDRPRLVPILPAHVETELEHSGLRRMGAHFGPGTGGQFGAVRALDLLFGRAIVTEFVPLPTLADMVRRTHRLSSRRSVELLLAAIRRSGAWLSSFHRVSPDDASPKRNATRDDLETLFEQYIAFLADDAVPSPWLVSMATHFKRHLRRAVPAELPLVCGHGDFGQHNLFVDDTRVIGFDTLAHWRVSPYEDLAYYLFLLETASHWHWPRRWKVGTATMAAARDVFLNAYFQDEPLAREPLPAFEILTALDKWASAVQSGRRASGLRRSAKLGRLIVQQRLLRLRIQRLLSDAEGLLSDPRRSARRTEGTANVL